MEIYKITDLTTGKIYVGQTTRTTEERFKEHMKADSLLGRAIRAHGVENFKIEVLEKCETIEQLNEREPYWIKYFDCLAKKGLNLTSGGNNGWEFAEEVKRQISITMTGRKQTDEHRENSSKAQQKRWMDPLEHEKASDAQIKRYENPAERAKTSAAIRKSRQENPIPESSRKQQAESLKIFYANNPEAIEHLSEMTQQQFATPESRARHSEIMVEYYAQNPVSAATREKHSEAMKKFYAENPEACERISEEGKKRWGDPQEHEKHSERMRKFYADNPEAATRMSEAQKKSYAENPERRKNQSIAQKARRARERTEREKARAAVEINLFAE